jgi:hypothetical protein
VAAYPEEARPVLPELFDLWVDHLWDNIPTVREDTAAALVRAATAYGDEAAAKVLAALRCDTGRAAQQQDGWARRERRTGGSGAQGSAAPMREQHVRAPPE